MKKARVLVAMSGGVDSSMSAILLKEKGYELVGVTLKVYENDNYRHPGLKKGIKDASILASQLKIPYYIIDIRKEFETKIINYFVDEYAGGRTPNPCALCNYTIKWNKLIEIADELDCQFVATGHYADINIENGRYYLSEAHDKLKDQTYFLWRLSQEYLKRTIFPLAYLTKRQTKHNVAEKGFSNIAGKSESYNICFIPEGNYREFLDNRLSAKEGKIITHDGRNLGLHNGIWNYTIGQQETSSNNTGKAHYVTKIDSHLNQIIVGEKSKLLIDSVLIKQLNFMKYESIDNGTELFAKINYKSPLVKCTVDKVNEGLLLQFSEAVYALAPGQPIVIYEGNDIVAGGVID